MEFNFSERDMLYILNCINIVLNYLKYHTREEKQFLDFYFNFNNYDEHYNKLIMLHRILSLNANKYFYEIDDNFFIIRDNNIYKTNKNKDREGGNIGILFILFFVMHDCAK